MTTIIAECCQNHNGDREVLKKQIWAAAEAGATYAKMQTIFADDITFRGRFEEGANLPTMEFSNVSAITRPYKPEYERLHPMDLSEKDHEQFIRECEAAGIKPLTAIFSRSRIPLVKAAGFKEVKVASYDCASFPMLRELKDNFSNLFVSTGATFDEEIQKTADILKGGSFSFLHCVTSYPNTLDMCNLSRIEWLKQLTPKVGWSDHTLVERDGIKAAKVAIMLGADVVERHFTILAANESKDGPVSINPQQLKELVEFSKMSNEEQKTHVEQNIPEWQTLLGTPTREMTEVELKNRDYYRGRFASKVEGKDIYNWQEEPAF